VIFEITTPEVPAPAFDAPAPRNSQRHIFWPVHFTRLIEAVRYPRYSRAASSRTELRSVKFVPWTQSRDGFVELTYKPRRETEETVFDLFRGFRAVFFKSILHVRSDPSTPILFPGDATTADGRLGSASTPTSPGKLPCVFNGRGVVKSREIIERP